MGLDAQVENCSPRNLASLAILNCRLINGEDCLWAQVLKAKYLIQQRLNFVAISSWPLLKEFGLLVR